MRMFDRWRRSKPEERASIEDPRYPISSALSMQVFGMESAASGVSVSIETALGVPAVWAAVNFMAGELSQLPLNVYQRTEAGAEKSKSSLQSILHDAVNEEWTSQAWRKYLFDSVFTEGRGLTFIEWNGAGKVGGLWPMEISRTTIKRENGRRRYYYRENGRERVFEASEVIDIPFMLKQDMVSHRSPIMTNKDTIGLAVAATQYGSKFFTNGGVPPFVITGPMNSAGALQRAADDLQDAVKKNAKEPRLALAMPNGHELKSIGVDPEKAQLVELQMHLIGQIARVYNLPPVFLQDLSHGTYSNTEQQDLFLVKHTITRWAEQFEQELNLKFFGRSNSQYVELNLDGLLRGDFKTRMEGYAQGIQNGVLKPNEARAMENRPDDPEGDRLMIQGATVPLGSQPAAAAPQPGDPANADS